MQTIESYWNRHELYKDNAWLQEKPFKIIPTGIHVA